MTGNLIAATAAFILACLMWAPFKRASENWRLAERRRNTRWQEDCEDLQWVTAGAALFLCAIAGLLLTRAFGS